MAEADVARTNRDRLSEPPARPKLRNAPKSQARSRMASLTSSDSDAADEADELTNSPDGESTEPDENESSELDSHPVTQGFEHLGKAIAHLQIVGTIFPEALLAVQDLITALKQIVPQAAMAMLSGNNANTSLASAGTSRLAALAGGQPAAGPLAGAAPQVGMTPPMPGDMVPGGMPGGAPGGMM